MKVQDSVKKKAAVTGGAVKKSPFGNKNTGVAGATKIPAGKGKKSTDKCK